MALLFGAIENFSMAFLFMEKESKEVRMESLQASDEKVIRSHCRICHGGCGVLVHVKDGRVIRIEGDPESPISRGTLCPKGIASIQLVHHPDRVIHPLKRAGAREEGRWERISWNEAFEILTSKMKEYKNQYGAESIVLGYGTGRDNEAFIYRFANLLGTPNVLTAGHMCYGPRVSTSIITCGNLPVCDYEGNPRCIMVWGNNAIISNPDEYKGVYLSDALAKGAKLIVVDPRFTKLADRSNLWLQLRPGTDVALALGILHVIIEEELYDKDFVQDWIYGWEEFVKRVREYSIKRVSQITWVPEEKIEEAARLFARTKPACIQWGVAIEQSINCVDNNRLLIALTAITGNLDVPGGMVFYVPPPTMNASQFGLHQMLPPEQRKKRLGGEVFKLADAFAIINPKFVWDAILYEEPYPVKMVFLISSNPLITRANASVVYEALKKVEFLAVSDFFLTPTAQLADLVLPAATWLEMDYVAEFWKRHGYVLARQKAIQVGECKSDHEVLNELGNRMGQKEHWWPTVRHALNAILAPSGLRFNEFVERGFLRGKMEYRKYEKKGFSTPTRKVELYSTRMKEWGYDPLSQFREPPESPLSRSDLLKDYPYILITGMRPTAFFHSEHRQIPWLRELLPEPFVEIHPETAEREGIMEGDWVAIESLRGKCFQRAKLTLGIDPRVIAAQHAWWFPEKDSPEHGWKDSNINFLTDNDPATCDPAMGATNLRVLLCRISKK
jgi:anaerobic selenocysteine-containing dehydrogenase